MAWHPWGEAALARARDLDRPIFLSIGYSTCHWCHVMERESFEDEAVAELLNARFVSVTVDREERPDVDAVYLSAVQALNRGRAGWPLTLVLTPAGEPLFAASYLPRDELMRVLGAVDQAWRTDRDTVLADAGALTAHLVRIATPSPPADVPGPEAVDAGVAGLQEAWDRQHGGFGGAPKHPSPARLDLLLRTGTHEPAVHTLHAMIRGGIHDRIGGGFHRYATDVAWNEPHYEKRLGDNAQLLRTLIAAWQATGDATFREVAESTAAHLLRDLRLASGAFASALDADEAYYTSDRAGRPPPARDDKVVTAFNGLAISALSRASVALGRPDLAEAAEGATRTVVDTALTPAGRLHRTSSSAGVLEDYTFLAEGLLDLFEATSDPRHVVQAASLMDTVEARFRDPAGGWFRTPDDAEELVVRPRPTQDAAASGVHVLLRLHDLTGDARWQEAADRVLSSYARDLRDAPARWPALLAALDRRHDAPREIVIVWPEGADPAALADVVRARFLPNATLVRLPEPAIKEAGWVVPWIAGKVPRDDKPTAYVCERGSCRQPTTDPEVLSQQLSAP